MALSHGCILYILSAVPFKIMVQVFPVNIQYVYVRYICGYTQNKMREEYAIPSMFAHTDESRFAQICFRAHIFTPFIRQIITWTEYCHFTARFMPIEEFKFASEFDYWDHYFLQMRGITYPYANSMSVARLFCGRELPFFANDDDLKIINAMIKQQPEALNFLYAPFDDLIAEPGIVRYNQIKLQTSQLILNILLSHEREKSIKELSSVKFLGPIMFGFIFSLAQRIGIYEICAQMCNEPPPFVIIIEEPFYSGTMIYLARYKPQIIGQSFLLNNGCKFILTQNNIMSDVLLSYLK